MSVTESRKLKMKFTTDAGSEHDVTIAHVKSGLESGEGAASVKAAMQSVVTQQPFEDSIQSISGAEIIETTSTEVEFE